MRRRSIPTVLVGPSALLREGLARILRGTDFRIAQSVATVQELRTESLTRHESPLLIVECGDDVGATVAEIESFRLQRPSGRIAVLVGNHPTEHVIAFFQAGANMLLVKSASRESFVRTLELAALGETLLPRELLAHVRPEGKRQLRSSDLAHEFAKEPEPAGRNGAPQLSGRERSILQCLIQGASNKGIARKIGIAESTVKVHVKTILRKIHASNRTQAAIWAMNNNLAAAPAIGSLAHALPLLPSGSVVMDVTPALNGEDTQAGLHRDELHLPSMTNGAADPAEP